MTNGLSKKKKRRRSSDNGDIDTSSSSRTRSSSDLLQTRTIDGQSSTTLDSDVSSTRTDTTTTTDTQTTNGDASRVRRDSTTSDSIALRQRQINGLQRSRTLNDLDSPISRDSDLMRRDSDSESTVNALRDDSTSDQRRRSLSDLAATIDTDATIPDLRPLRFRSQSVGADTSSFRQKPFDESSLNSLLDSMDQGAINESPLVEELSLNDSRRDADDENFVEDAATDLEVSARRSSYSQDESNWRPLPQEADNALRELQAEFTIAEDAIGPESIVVDLLPNIYAEDGQGVSREILNDVYFLSKEHISATVDNPLLRDNQLPNAGKQRIQRMITLVKAIDKMKSRKAFLVPEDAQAYNGYKLNDTSMGATSLTTREREIHQTYGSSLTDTSFNRTQDSSELHNTITSYRQTTLERLTTDLQALEALFDDKLIKKEHHKRVLRAQDALQKAINRINPLLNNPSDPNTTDARDQLHLAIDAMRAAAETYRSAGRKDKKRVQSRLDACQHVLDRLDQLTVTDDRIINSRLTESFRTIENARNTLRQLGPEAINAFDKTIDDLFFNASPDANAQTVFDSLGTALNLAAFDKRVGDSTAFTNAQAVSTGFGIGTTASSIVADVSKAYSFIKGLKEAGVVTKRDALNGGLILVNTTKNASTAIKTGIDIADKVSGVSAAVGATATVAGITTGAAGTAIGVGFTVHGGYVAYKTNLRVKPAEGIDDANIRAQVIDRINKKRRRAILKAVGGAVAVVGGVAAIVATAGAATPVVVAIGVAAAAASTTVGLGLSGERGVRAAVKMSKGTTGKEREALATEVFVHMNALLASGKYNKAKELAQSLTNNKFKQNLMLRGADASASDEDQQAALMIMRDKLKTW